MRLSDFFGRQRSARVARERLQILLTHERGAESRSDLIPKLREEVLAAVAKYVAVDPDKVQVKLDRGKMVSILEIDIEVPTLESACLGSKVAGQSPIAKDQTSVAAAGASV